MKNLLILLLALGFTSGSLHAQRAADVVKWNYAAMKGKDGTVTISLTAKLKEGWHIYANPPGGDGSQIPTTIKFDKKAGVALVGGITSDSKVTSERIEELDITIRYYKNTVTFKQKVKAPAKTRLTGTIQFQPCDEEKCLPPANQKFEVSIP